MKTAQEVTKFLIKNPIDTMFCFAIVQIFVFMIFHSITIVAMDQKFYELDQDMEQITVKLEELTERTTYVQDDISELGLMIDSVLIQTDPKVEEDKSETHEVYGDEEKDKIVSMIFDIAPVYEISPYMVMAMIERESNYKANATNGQYKGLLQISERWHGSRMKDLGVTDLYDPAGNITVACSYLKDLYDLYEDQELVLMCYSMDNNKAMELHRKGQVSVYAASVIERMRELEEGYGD